jgi:Uri superfamily endonuclease
LINARQQHGEIQAWLPSGPGTYALILRCAAADEQIIGALGKAQVRKGFYIYVGSALGPGGIRSRVSHHLRTAKKLHWHIDYLRQKMPINAVWYAQSTSVQEHHWARTLACWSLTKIAVQGFGASDCQCESHLFFCQVAPSLTDFRDRLEADALQPDVQCAQMRLGN